MAGAGGDDTLRGGAGGDRLDGGAGIDTVTYTESGIGVVISLPAVQVSGGNAQGDVLIGIENLHGSAGADSLTGDGLANVLNGWAGKDQLTGGGGADRFTFHAVTHSAVGDAADRVADFSHAQGDRIDLSVIDADTTQAGNQGFSFIGTGTYSGAAGQLRYQQFGDGTTTVVAGDVNGDGTSDFHIRCAGTIAFASADFVL
ncbi:M10 family metallopeptidase C-terminal domain-containing protein [Inquilinus limosus]